MKIAFFLPILFLMLAGCSRTGDPTGSIANTQTVEVTLFDGYRGGEAVLVGQGGLRVGGGYFDFSPYDTLRIGFTARRSEPGTSVARILVRIGPVTYRQDSVVTDQKLVAIILRVADLSKSTFAAVTIYATEAGVPLLLSDLSVVGTHH